jgi:hypothetical protein
VGQRVPKPGSASSIPAGAETCIALDNAPVGGDQEALGPAVGSATHLMLTLPSPSRRGDEGTPRS